MQEWRDRPEWHLARAKIFRAGYQEQTWERIKAEGAEEQGQRGGGGDRDSGLSVRRTPTLTSVSPERTSSREMRLCPSLRSSYRSVTCLWAWGGGGGQERGQCLFWFHRHFLMRSHVNTVHSWGCRPARHWRGGKTRKHTELMKGKEQNITSCYLSSQFFRVSIWGEVFHIICFKLGTKHESHAWVERKKRYDVMPIKDANYWYFNKYNTALEI